MDCRIDGLKYEPIDFLTMIDKFIFRKLIKKKRTRIEEESGSRDPEPQVGKNKYLNDDNSFSSFPCGRRFFLLLKHWTNNNRKKKLKIKNKMLRSYVDC